MAPEYSRLILGLVSFLLVLDYTTAYSCYMCHGQYNKTSGNPCSDPFDKSKLPTGSAYTCTPVNYCSKSLSIDDTGMAYITRGCDGFDSDQKRASVKKDQCADCSFLGQTYNQCVCQSDLCNEGAMNRPFHLTFILPLMLAVGMGRYFQVDQ